MATNPLLDNDAMADDYPASWNDKKKNSDEGVAIDFEDDELLSRLSLSSVNSVSARLSGARLSTTEFENAPHKLLTEINPGEAAKWLDPMHPNNRAIFASYLAVGFGLFFIQTPIAFYMVDSLNATPGQQSVITGLLALPWALKVCSLLSYSLLLLSSSITIPITDHEGSRY